MTEMEQIGENQPKLYDPLDEARIMEIEGNSVEALSSYLKLASGLMELDSPAGALVALRGAIRCAGRHRAPRPEWEAQAQALAARVLSDEEELDTLVTMLLPQNGDRDAWKLGTQADLERLIRGEKVETPFTMDRVIWRESGQSLRPQVPRWLGRFGILFGARRRDNPDYVKTAPLHVL